MKEKPKFYISFGQGHPDKDGLYEIEAHNMDNARNIARKLFGNNYSDIYTRVEIFGLDGGEYYAKVERFPQGIINKHL